MRERPILFSGPMVRAILSGAKTQTRRVVKPQPPMGCEYIINGAYSHALCRSIENPDLWVPPTARSTDHRLPCPCGQPGDRLYVKERHEFVNTNEHGVLQCLYKADDALRDMFDAPYVPKMFRGRPPICMPRWASRITLEITEIRVERLNEIGEGDAKAEGIVPHRKGGWCWEQPPKGIEGTNHFGAKTARDAYSDLWESINGPGSWEQNPYVWVIAFRRVAPLVGGEG